MLESGIDPATVRFEVGKCPYCKYSIFVRELVPLPPELSSCTVNTHKAPGGIGGRGVRGVETCGGGSGSGCERAGRRAAGQGEAPITPRLGQGTAGDNEK